MDTQRKAFESSNNVNPDWSFKFDEELQQYIALDSEMRLQVDEFNEHWDTFRAGWQAAIAQAVPKWISVEDKLPKDGDCVLCIHEGGNQHVMMFTQRFKNRISWVKCFLHHDGCGQFQEFYDIGDYCEITHWMPLPDAPQEPAND